jgi:hypothetical protein
MPEDAPVITTTLPLKSSFLKGLTKTHQSNLNTRDTGKYTKRKNVMDICINTLRNPFNMFM